MALEDIQQLIVNVTGLESNVMGSAVVQRAVNSRMDQSGVDEVRGYSAMLYRSDKEQQALIDEVTVPETWFFRDKKPFEFLTEYAAHALKNRKKTNHTPLRILSLPCSSGEEAYSIAMSLFDAGYALDQFHVDAVDINTRVLARAKIGCYGRHSFRGEIGAYQRRYFSENNGEYQIDETLKSAVSFVHGNVIDPVFMKTLMNYDVVFCRNLLIYFNLKNRKKVLSHLHGQLRDQGLLFLGHSEIGRGVEYFFESIKKPNTFAYKKKKIINKEASQPAFNFSWTEKKIKTFPIRKALTPIESRQRPDVAKKQREPGVGSFLSDVESLANRGELDAAYALSLKLIKQYPDEANVYFWLGIICLGLALDDEAFDALRKALYLKPKHYQSLVQLANLSEQKGNNEAAKNYRTRLHRLRSGDV